MNVTKEDVDKEMKATDYLCKGKHVNIIKIFQQELFEPLESLPFCLIDMEFSDTNLEEYVKGTKPNIPGLMPWNTVITDGDGIFIVVAIMQQLLGGIGFIHEKGYTHRNLKPQNGALTSRVMLRHFSIILLNDGLLENCRLWSGFYGNDKATWDDRRT